MEFIGEFLQLANDSEVLISTRQEQLVTVVSRYIGEESTGLSRWNGGALIQEDTHCCLS